MQSRVYYWTQENFVVISKAKSGCRLVVKVDESRVTVPTQRLSASGTELPAPALAASHTDVYFEWTLQPVGAVSFSDQRPIGAVILVVINRYDAKDISPARTTGDLLWAECHVLQDMSITALMNLFKLGIRRMVRQCRAVTLATRFRRGWMAASALHSPLPRPPLLPVRTAPSSINCDFAREFMLICCELLSPRISWNISKLYITNLHTVHTQRHMTDTLNEHEQWHCFLWSYEMYL